MTSDIRVQGVTHVLFAIEVLSYIYMNHVYGLFQAKMEEIIISMIFCFLYGNLDKQERRNFLVQKRDFCYIKFYNNEICTLFYEATGNSFLFTKHYAGSLRKDN
jgi:hypothetical protein